MNILRVLLTLLLLPAFILLVRGTGSRSRAFRGIVLLAGVGAAGIVINFPGLLDRSAEELGINSGADLTLYLLVLSLLTLVGYIVGKFRRIEQRLARLVHEIAVQDSRAPESTNRNSRDSDGGN